MKRKTIKALGESYGIIISDTPVCAGHTDLLTVYTAWFYDRPELSLLHGPRGGGKSMGAGFVAHITSLFYPNHETKILGGSEAQSMQIHNAVKAIASVRMLEEDLRPDIQATRTKYSTGSEVNYIAASEKSVRGPHVPTLCLDEVDEIDIELREAAVGMSKGRGDIHGCIMMMSTWHRVSGPMAELVKRGRAGEFPVWTFCLFEVLERCPDSRSGANLEKCVDCPLKQWCHSDIGTHPSGLPKAKRSNGHYRIEDAIQKVKAVSRRVFESDYLCLRPKASRLWFTQFDEDVHVSESAEYDRNRDFHVSIDPGVHTGAIWFQVYRSWDGHPIKVSVFGDYYATDVAAATNAKAIVAKTQELTGIGIGYARVSIDPASKAKTAVGPTVKAEYINAGCVGRAGKLEEWPHTGNFHPKTDGLKLLEAIVMTAEGTPILSIHPRCEVLVQSFHEYRRKVIAGQIVDVPEDPQHPAEECIDCLAGGAKLEFPKGRLPTPPMERPGARRHAGGFL